MKLARSFVAIMAVAALGACGDEDPEETTIAGVYTVSEFRYTSDAQDGPEVDLAGIPESSGGPYGILSMEVEEDHSFAGELMLPGFAAPYAIGGDITLTGSNGIRIDFDAATQALQILDPFEVGTYAMVNNTLTIILPNVTFDFGALSGNPQGAVESDLKIVGTRS